MRFVRLLSLVVCFVAPAFVDGDIAFAQPKPNPGNAGKTPPRTLADLVPQAARPGEFPPPPPIDEARAKQQGIRVLAGKYVTLLTDLPAAADVDELPTVFDRAVPGWCAYLGVDEKQTARWKLVGHLVKDKARFAAAGLLPDDLPPFLNGYQRDAQFWLYDQPSPYYVRHLLIHEGTHAFMAHFLGGTGPPWYSEGMAELLGTHSWEQGKLTLGVMPAHRDEVPYWGRIKIVRDEFAANRGLMPLDVMRYDAHAHLKNEPYGWSWAAAYFFDRHPTSQQAFRDCRTRVGDRTLEFSKQLYEQLKPHWPALMEDWQLFVAELDYGYDLPRVATVRGPAAALPPRGTSIAIAADRGWQTSGVKVEAGKTYRLSASGQFEVGREPRPWLCEANGVTIRYHNGRPLGMLLAAVSDRDDNPAASPLLSPQAVGLTAEIKPTTSGTLYLRINESAGGLADNRGTLTVRVE